MQGIKYMTYRSSVFSLEKIRRSVFVPEQNQKKLWVFILLQNGYVFEKITFSTRRLENVLFPMSQQLVLQNSLFYNITVLCWAFNINHQISSRSYMSAVEKVFKCQPPLLSQQAQVTLNIFLISNVRRRYNIHSDCSNP